MSEGAGQFRRVQGLDEAWVVEEGHSIGRHGFDRVAWMGSKAKQQRAEKGMVEKEPGPGLLDPDRGWEVLLLLLRRRCHYRHKLAEPPIISWPELASFRGARMPNFGDSKDKLAASSAFQAKRGRGCCVALRGNYLFELFTQREVKVI
jgi:hypothetical protein